MIDLLQQAVISKLLKEVESSKTAVRSIKIDLLDGKYFLTIPERQSDIGLILSYECQTDKNHTNPPIGFESLTGNSLPDFLKKHDNIISDLQAICKRHKNIIDSKFNQELLKELKKFLDKKFKNIEVVETATGSFAITSKSSTPIYAAPILHLRIGPYFGITLLIQEPESLDNNLVISKDFKQESYPLEDSLEGSLQVLRNKILPKLEMILPRI